MAKKTVWHTDIVVSGQGLGLEVVPERSGCFRVKLKPDTPGKSAVRAQKRFLKAADARGVCFSSASGAKDHVERGIIKSKARWNKWHRESY